jgi:hypothetical protein
MGSPFAGMDPYLEDQSLWQAFHFQFITSLYQTLLPELSEHYRARIGHRLYITEQALFTSVVREEHREQFIEIRKDSEGRLITHIELVSPANKTLAAGARAYLLKRQDARFAGANLVEIDLVLAGKGMQDYTARTNIPEWDYIVAVTRATHPDRVEVYTTTLDKRLPRFRMPLAGDDRDQMVDLQTVFLRSYDHGGFGANIDYQRDPTAPLTSQERQWLDQYLRQANLRQ